MIEFKELKPKVKRVLAIALDCDFEIVSYGVPPNPNGFCFETPDPMDFGDRDRDLKIIQNQARIFSGLLDNLDKEETKQLKDYIFG